MVLKYDGKDHLDRSCEKLRSVTDTQAGEENPTHNKKKTRYGLDGLGIEPRCGGVLPHPPRPALGPTQPPIQRVPGLVRGKSGLVVALNTQPYVERS